MDHMQADGWKDFQRTNIWYYRAKRKCPVGNPSRPDVVKCGFTRVLTLQKHIDLSHILTRLVAMPPSAEAVIVSMCLAQTIGLVDVDDDLYRACQSPGVPALFFPVELYKTTNYKTGGLHTGQTGALRRVTWRLAG